MLQITSFEFSVPLAILSLRFLRPRRRRRRKSVGYQLQQQLLEQQHPEPQQEQAPGSGSTLSSPVQAKVPCRAELRCSTTAVTVTFMRHPSLITPALPPSVPVTAVRQAAAREPSTPLPECQFQAIYR